MVKDKLQNDKLELNATQLEYYNQNLIRQIRNQQCAYVDTIDM
ncbi:hypothetical protein GCM10009410_21160 [Shewanella ulleungensis]|jgi:hypothetical protein|uniref:Uncharacterized protein n=1 Tax=Shewanella ulleungensis TaxID=2282699 RepID=A0ABQ2QNM9_9GAMM|nr:hypothetical protein GCM10009410_21160 [Shewanella ulleungensis]